MRLKRCDFKSVNEKFFSKVFIWKVKLKTWLKNLWAKTHNWKVFIQNMWLKTKLKVKTEQSLHGKLTWKSLVEKVFWKCETKNVNLKTKTENVRLKCENETVKLKRNSCF